MREPAFIEFAVDNGYLDPATVCSGIWPEDHVEDPAYIAYHKYLDVLHDRSLFKKVVDYVFAK